MLVGLGQRWARKKPTKHTQVGLEMLLRRVVEGTRSGPGRGGGSVVHQRHLLPNGMAGRGAC